MSRKAPERIETERLLLRRPIRSDVAAIFSRYASDAEVTRYLAWPRHLAEADTGLFLDFSDSEWNRHHCGPYLVVSRTSGELLGGTGLALLDDDLAETGYVFARDAWGCGYATESVRAMLDLARSLGLRQVRARCHPDHHASMRVLAKCGFVFASRTCEDQVYPNLDPRRQDVITYRFVILDS